MAKRVKLKITKKMIRDLNKIRRKLGFPEEPEVEHEVGALFG